jgi:hypothetical protein
MLHKDYDSNGSVAKKKSLVMTLLQEWQLQVGGWRGTSSLQLLRLQARQGRDAKEQVAKSAKEYNGKDVLFQAHYP